MHDEYLENKHFSTWKGIVIHLDVWRFLVRCRRYAQLPQFITLQHFKEQKGHIVLCQVSRVCGSVVHQR